MGLPRLEPAMLFIFPPNTSPAPEEKKNAVKVVWEKKDSSAKPADWAFMEQSGEVLKNLPDTWKKYPKNDAGMIAIIGMEYNEFQQTVTENKPREDKMRELVHLASACLHYWRHLNAAE